MHTPTPIGSSQLLEEFSVAKVNFARKGVPLELRYRYVMLRCFEGASHADAMTRVYRLASVARRWGEDAKPCFRCSTRMDPVQVLWRHEAGRAVAINKNGTLHGCL